MDPTDCPSCHRPIPTQGPSRGSCSCGYRLPGSVLAAAPGPDKSPSSAAAMAWGGLAILIGLALGYWAFAEYEDLAEFQRDGGTRRMKGSLAMLYRLFGPIGPPLAIGAGSCVFTLAGVGMIAAGVGPVACRIFAPLTRPFRRPARPAPLTPVQPVPPSGEVFRLPCECGEDVRVSAAMAGSAVRCGCGRSLAVPSLGRLRGSIGGGEGAG